MSEVQKVIDKYGEIILNTIKNKLKSGNKIATVNLINSLTYKYSYTGGQYRIQITGAPYLINIDRGRRPGKYVPIQPLIKWIKIKRIPIGFNRRMKPTSTITGSNKPLIARGKNKPPDQVIRGMAFAISKSIKKEGIKPFPILNLGVTVARSSKFKQDIAAAIVADMRKAIKLP